MKTRRKFQLEIKNELARIAQEIDEMRRQRRERARTRKKRRLQAIAADTAKR